MTPQTYALFAHCFTCSKDLKAVYWISRELAQRGVGVLRFDFTGLGESEGDFAETNFSSNLEDLVAAADFLRREYAAPSILIGHSLGGAAVLAAASKVPEARAVVTINATSNPASLARAISSRAPEIEARGEAEVVLGGRRFRVKQQFLDDLREQNLQEAINKLGRALLVLHSPTDGIVGIDHARRIFEAARHPKSFVVLDGADHLLMNPRDARYAATLISGWGSRYFETVAEEEQQEGTSSPQTVVVESCGERIAQDVRVGRHFLRADEPTALGGEDSGPSPYDLLLAGLGSCTSMTLQMYARRKKWAIDDVTVKLQHGKIHAKDCADCETTTGKIDRIEREIALVGDLTSDQRARLLEIADRCPVHRSLRSEVKIETKLADT